mmetsp:Transcript_16102/g.48498  ORF Transcript_16102/g.48498 Transcript_16102/m.48498 type:complete len:238 (-) Transcript_16102:272-985(-)
MTPRTRAATGSPEASSRWPKAESGLAGMPPLATTNHSAVSQQCHASARSVQLSPSRAFSAFTGTSNSSMSIAAASVAPCAHTSQRRLTRPLLQGRTPSCTSCRARDISPRLSGEKMTPVGASGRAPHLRSQATSRQSPSKPAARAAMSTRPRRRPRRTSTKWMSAPRSASRAQVVPKFRAAAALSNTSGLAPGSNRTRTSSALSRSRVNIFASAQDKPEAWEGTGGTVDLTPTMAVS